MGGRFFRPTPTRPCCNSRAFLSLVLAHPLRSCGPALCSQHDRSRVFPHIRVRRPGLRARRFRQHAGRKLVEVFANLHGFLLRCLCHTVNATRHLPFRQVRASQCEARPRPQLEGRSRVIILRLIRYVGQTGYILSTATDGSLTGRSRVFNCRNPRESTRLHS